MGIVFVGSWAVIEVIFGGMFLFEDKECSKRGLLV